MTLTPDTRTLLSDALRPPAGHTLEAAVATTYSLDLTAALLVPLTLAFPEHDGATPDPVALLDALQRHSDRLAIFHQAGGLRATDYRSLYAFLEDAIHAVDVPGRLFHPKVWALRFAGQGGATHHRVLVLSRNLTLDTSWDTALVLEQVPDGADSPESATHPIPGEPLAHFLRSLPSLATGPLPTAQRALVASLADSLGRVGFGVPAGYDSGEFLPLGIEGLHSAWPAPERASRVLAISPFLDQTQVGLLPAAATRVLVTRAETLDRLGAKEVSGWDTRVLAPAAEGDLAAAEAEADTDNLTGLHAKVLITDLGYGTGPDSLTITGSPNLTSAAWGRSGRLGNVELAVALSGPTRKVGVTATLEGEGGLGAVLQAHSASTQEGLLPATEELERALEDYHRALSGLPIAAEVTPESDDLATLAIEVRTLPAAPAGATSRARPASLPRGHAQPLCAGERLVFRGLPAARVTPFLAVETSAPFEDGQVSARCVLRLEVAGDDALRRRAAVREVLASRADMMRYLAYLLGAPMPDDAADLAVDRAEAGCGPAAGGAGSPLHIPDLFERLVRAAARDDRESLTRIDQALSMIPDAQREDLLPEGFEGLWAAVTEAARD